MITLIQEIQRSVRRLRASPGFTTAATLTLAIAIGGTASMFGVVDGVLLKPLPFRAPNGLMTLWENNPEGHNLHVGVSPANFLDWRALNHTFAALAALEPLPFTVTEPNESERLIGSAVTPNFFSVLGVRMALGRPLSQDSGGSAEVVISNAYWQRRFGGAPAALGRRLTLDNKPYTIVGVMPAGVPGSTELWTRLSFSATDETNRGMRYLLVYGRLKARVPVESGRREMEAIAGHLATAFPKTNRNWFALTIPVMDEVVGDVRGALFMLLAAAACVLLVGAANLANLFLVRCLGRQRETALRSALGATRGRLARELVADAALVGIAAGMFGVGVAVAGVRVLREFAPPSLPRLNQIGIDVRLMIFCLLTSVVAVLVFGALPAWHASRANLAGVLREGSRGTGSAQRHRLQDGLVVAQIAIALVLLTGAGLFVESFAHFRRMDPGFRSESVLSAQISLPIDRYPSSELQATLVANVLQRLAGQSGVVAVSAVSELPSGETTVLGFTVIGDPILDPTGIPSAYAVAVSPDYFKTMGIAVRRGRVVLSTDDSRSVRIAIVDDLLARRFFGGRDPIGHRLTWGGTDTMEIVGVVAGVKQGGLAVEDRPEIYVPFAQFPTAGPYIVARASGDPRPLAKTIRAVIANLDRAVPVSDLQVLSERVAMSVATTRFCTVLASLFALVALLLGLVGLYSVLAHIVSQRQREIAVRIALGATRANVMGEVLVRALSLTGIGIAFGTGGGWVLTRSLATLFVGVSPHDPAILAGAAVAFVTVGLAAAAVPAFRTTQISPVAALKST